MWLEQTEGRGTNGGTGRGWLHGWAARWMNGCQMKTGSCGQTQKIHNGSTVERPLSGNSSCWAGSSSTRSLGTVQAPRPSPDPLIDLPRVLVDAEELGAALLQDGVPQSRIVCFWVVGICGLSLGNVGAWERCGRVGQHPRGSTLPPKRGSRCPCGHHAPSRSSLRSLCKLDRPRLWPCAVWGGRDSQKPESPRADTHVSCQTPRQPAGAGHWVRPGGPAGDPGAGTGPKPRPWGDRGCAGTLSGHHPQPHPQREAATAGPVFWGKQGERPRSGPWRHSGPQTKARRKALGRHPLTGAQESSSQRAFRAA